MRVMVVGQKWLGEQTLRLCLQRGYDVACVSAPGASDRLATLAAGEGIPVCPTSGRLDASQVPSGIDLLLCAHAHVFIPSEARSKARLGALGYHPSLLPRHRGRDAIRWAIHMGDKLTGGTAYWMDDGADTGPIAAQGWCWIRPGDTPELLWRRDLAPLGLQLLGQVLGDAEAGKVTKVPQDATLATWEPAFTTGKSLATL